MSGVLLAEPDLCKRGSFGRAYSRAKSNFTPDMKTPRLLDCLLVRVPYGDPCYFDEPEAGEFAVVDVANLDKAYFDMPMGCTPDMVTGMIASTFNSSAFRVGHKLWFV